MPQSTQIALDACLADLERRVDPDVEAGQLAAWRGFLDGRCAGPVFRPPPRPPAPARIDWPDVHINDAQDDPDLMLLHQFASVSGVLARGGTGPLLNVRCNYGTGIVPSLFGCDLYTMPRESHTLPTALPMHSSDAMRRLLDAGVPDLSTGLGARVFDTAERFLAALERHPKLRQAVTLYHPDAQGPVDIVEVVWGSEMFLAVYDEPDLLHAVLDLVTGTYIAFLRRWYALVPPRHGPYSVHWGMLHRGTLMLRDDSLMNLSPQTYVEFVRPRDQRLFDTFGGGAMHFCGRGDHYIAPMGEMPGLAAVHASQPELNDMETILRHTVDRGIVLLDLQRPAVDAALARGRDLRGRVHCWG